MVRLTLLLAALFFVLPVSGAEDGVHLFVLSGQSNMAGHRPDEAFTPAIEKALGKENVVIVQDAMGGQPIYRWYKKWKSPQGDEPANRGDLYDRLMSKVKPAIEGKKLKSVTFFWMQGERDAKMAWGDIYGEALQGLYDQFSKDIGVTDVRFVNGRLSDFDMGNQKYPHWTRVREAQVELAEGNPLFDWVDTDDLNDGKNRGGKPISNDLHYSGEGYITFGKRMAEKGLALLKE